MSEISSIFSLTLMSIAVVLWLIRGKSGRRRSLPDIENKIKDSTQKDEPVSNDWNFLIQAYWNEYGAVRDEFLKRVEISSQVQVYAVLLLSGTIPLVEYVNNVGLKGGSAYILFLLAALVFCALGWYQLDLDDKVADMDNYVLGVLKPNLEKALAHYIQNTDELNNILGWHYYWRADRYNSIGGRLLSMGVIGRSGVPIIGASVLLGSYIYFEHFIQAAPWNPFRIFLVCLVAFGIIWMLVAGMLVSNKLTKGMRSYQENRTL